MQAPKVFCAIDTTDMSRAEALVSALSALPVHFKFGLELFNAQGLSGVQRLRGAMRKEAEIFLDLKLHDIPNTVAGAVRAVSVLQPQFLTVHAAGGAAMVEAAVDAAGSNTKILGVTVLTRLGAEDLPAIGIDGAAEAQVERLARLALKAGAGGIVCSPREVAGLRADLGLKALLVVPGIRPAGSVADDQKRTLTPKEAAQAGADALVIGRPITAAADPVAAARAILEDLI